MRHVHQSSEVIGGDDACVCLDVCIHMMHGREYLIMIIPRQRVPFPCGHHECHHRVQSGLCRGLGGGAGARVHAVGREHGGHMEQHV